MVARVAGLAAVLVAVGDTRAGALAAAGDIRVVVIAATRRRSGAMVVVMVAAMAGIVTPMGAVMRPVATRLADSMRGEAITTAIASGRGLTLASGLAFRLGMAITPVVMPIVDADIPMAGVIGNRHLAIPILTTVISAATE